MMMRLAISLLSLTALSACAGVGLQSTKDCPGGPSGPPKLIPVNINYSPKQIIVAPHRACARPGDVLRFNLNGAPNVLVAAKGKTAADNWIKGSGKNQWFFVIVPHDLLPDGVDEKLYKYGVTAAGSPDLDPEVRIRQF